MTNDELQQLCKRLTTVQDCLHWASDQLQASDAEFGQGYDCAWDEVVQLLLHVLGLPADQDDGILDSVMTVDQREKFLEQAILRIEQKVPTAYLIHKAWFCGLPFYVDERVLIPRSPIGELIQTGFSPWLKSQKVDRILDLCTGSGCIAIACSFAFPDALVIGADISTDALDVAKINVEQLGASQVSLEQSDLFGQLEGTFDLIVSNPPYVCQEEVDSLPLEFGHEPELALVAGGDGMDIVRRMLSEAANYLTPQGILVVEVGYSQPLLEAAFPKVPFMWLEFEHGGQGVFLFTQDELRSYFGD